MEEKANVEIKKTIDSLEFLIDEDCSDTQFDYIEEIESAIKALTELQQYHAIGTLEELQDMKSNYFEALSDWRQYCKIGTLEECRTAREKQILKKPIFNHNFSDTLSLFHCECGNTIKVSHDAGIMDNNNAPNYCSECGCRLDWSDEE